MNRRRACDRSTGHTARVSGPSGDRAGMTRQPRPRWADDIDDNDRAAPTDAAAGGREKLATIANFHRYESRRRSRNCEQIAISHQRGHRLYQPNRCPPRAQAGRPKRIARPARTGTVIGPRSPRLPVWRPRTNRTHFLSSTSTKTIPSASAVTVWARPA